MENARMRLGKRGETEACRYLTAKGHVIVDRNWRSGHLEIDLVTLDGSGLHFVEVKSRTAPFTAHPLDSVGRTKQKRVADAAKAWLHSEKKIISADVEVFFDVVSVIFAGEEVRVEYYPQAYMPIII